MDCGAFAPFKERLHFVDGTIGLVCVELDDALRTAYFACITHDLSERVARVLCIREGFSVKDVRAWGELLRRAITADRVERDAF